MAITFPLTGKTYRVDYGQVVLDHDYSVPGQISYTVRQGPRAGYRATVEIEVTKIREDVFALTFQTADATAVLIEDLAAGTVNNYMVLKADNTLVHLQGTLTERRAGA